MIQSPELPDISKANIQPIHDSQLEKMGVSMAVLRLDKIHTIISGNKWFKLRYYLEDAIEQGKKGILTLGGAYSNHLVATAYACALTGLEAIGIVRGEEPRVYSPTLTDASLYGMKFRFEPRQSFRNSDWFLRLQKDYSEYLVIDEGGRGREGIKGAEEILQIQHVSDYSHILCAVGTGTMMTGLINSSSEAQHIIGIPVLKISQHPTNDIADFVTLNSSSNNFSFQYDFHFGGYAKRTPELLTFMNNWFSKHHIPTDFVYTGKLFYAAYALVSTEYFTPGSKILVVHSGGLQGNRSLPPHVLDFSY